MTTAGLAQERRALTLPSANTRAAEIDLRVRQTDEAFDNALSAAVAAHDASASCRIADQAAATPSVSKSVLVLAALAYDVCGRPERAQALRRG